MWSRLWRSIRLCSCHSVELYHITTLYRNNTKRRTNRHAHDFVLVRCSEFYTQVPSKAVVCKYEEKDYCFSGDLSLFIPFETIVICKRNIHLIRSRLLCSPSILLHTMHKILPSCLFPSLDMSVQHRRRVFVYIIGFFFFLHRFFYRVLYMIVFPEII